MTREVETRGQHSRNELGETRQEETKLNTLNIGHDAVKVKLETLRHKLKYPVTGGRKKRHAQGNKTGWGDNGRKHREVNTLKRMRHGRRERNREREKTGLGEHT